MGDDHIRVHLESNPEIEARARAKAWELIKSRVAAGGTEFDALVFSDFAHEMLNKGDRGFMLSVIGQLDRIAADIIARWSEDTQQVPIQLADLVHEHDERGISGRSTPELPAG